MRRQVGARSDAKTLVLYKARDFSTLRRLRGIPDLLVEAHLKLYQGYVENVNLLRCRLTEVGLGTPEWAAMKRRVGFELNGMRLHELYFENLTSRRTEPSVATVETLSAAWDLFPAWEREFRAMGEMRGVGWVILYRDPATDRLSNHWIDLHDEGHPAGFIPLLVMDVWEHAFTGMRRSDYVEAFLENVDWSRVDARLNGALKEQRAGLRI